MVRVGSLCLNHPEVVHKHPTHIATSGSVLYALKATVARHGIPEVVAYSSLSSYSEFYTLGLIKHGTAEAGLHNARHAFLGMLTIEVSCPLRDGVVRVGSMCLNHPDVVHKHPTRTTPSQIEQVR